MSVPVAPVVPAFLAPGHLLSAGSIMLLYIGHSTAQSAFLHIFHGNLVTHIPASQAFPLSANKMRVATKRAITACATADLSRLLLKPGDTVVKMLAGGQMKIAGKLGENDMEKIRAALTGSIMIPQNQKNLFLKV